MWNRYPSPDLPRTSLRFRGSPLRPRAGSAAALQSRTAYLVASYLHRIFVCLTRHPRALRSRISLVSPLVGVALMSGISGFARCDRQPQLCSPAPAAGAIGLPVLYPGEGGRGSPSALSSLTHHYPEAWDVASSMA